MFGQCLDKRWQGAVGSAGSKWERPPAQRAARVFAEEVNLFGGVRGVVRGDEYFDKLAQQTGAITLCSEPGSEELVSGLMESHVTRCVPKTERAKTQCAGAPRQGR